jgi:hypothetical protein
MKCETLNCKGSVKTGKVCSKCKSRKYREQHPIRSAFDNLKMNSKRRGKDFTLTLEEFKEFCNETKYHKKKGRFKYSYHIDRKDETLGYTKDNIQILQNHENVKKYLIWAYCESQRKMLFHIRVSKTTPENEDCPF